MCCLFNRWIKLGVWLCGRQFDETRLRTTVTDTFSSSWIDLKRHSVSSVMSDRRIIIWIYHVDSSFDHKVTLSIVIILKIEVSPIDSHWKIQFSNPEKGPKSEENDPPPLSEDWVRTGLWCIPTLSDSCEYLRQKLFEPMLRSSCCIHRLIPEMRNKVYSQDFAIRPNTQRGPFARTERHKKSFAILHYEPFQPVLT